jgi:hypothetical protein
MILSDNKENARIDAEIPHKQEYHAHFVTPQRQF